jgi:hypothetical protein
VAVPLEPLVKDIAFTRIAARIWHITSIPQCINSAASEGEREKLPPDDIGLR